MDDEIAMKKVSLEDQGMQLYHCYNLCYFMCGIIVTKI